MNPPKHERNTLPRNVFDSFPPNLQKTMKIFRQFLSSDKLGFFVADAIHENGIIQSLKVHPVRNGVVIGPLGFDMSSLSELVENMQENLTDCLSQP